MYIIARRPLSSSSFIVIVTVSFDGWHNMVELDGQSMCEDRIVDNRVKICLFEITNTLESRGSKCA